MIAPMQYLMAAAGLFAIAAPVVMYADSRGRRWLLLACTVVWALLVLLAYTVFRREMADFTATEWMIVIIVLAGPAAAVGVVVSATASTRLPGLLRGALAVVMGVAGLPVALVLAFWLVCGLTGDCL